MAMLYTKTCEVCNLEFTTNQPNQLVCGKICRDKKYYITTSRSSMLDKVLIPSGTMGAISELIISVDLLKNGYNVFRAMSPSCPCDLVVFKGDNIKRVEVKTGYRNIKTNNIVYPTPANSHYDIVGIFLRNDNKIIYINKEKEYIDVDKIFN